MDSNPVVSGAVGASIATAFYIAVKIIQYINHTRIRSSCCGKKMEASIDIEQTSPPVKSETKPSPLTLREVIVQPAS